MANKMVDVIQINVGNKRYFCKTEEEQVIFSENNPNAKTETFRIELPDFIAKKYLNEPSNKEQFKRKPKEEIKESVNA